ncbi:unnamed protein product, partial [Porites evermanni]
QKKPNDDAGTSHSETSKKRKVFQKVENSCMDPVLKDSNGLPSASMTEGLAESMDLTKSQCTRYFLGRPYGSASHTDNFVPIVAYVLGSATDGCAPHFSHMLVKRKLLRKHTELTNPTVPFLATFVLRCHGEVRGIVGEGFCEVELECHHKW